MYSVDEIQGVMCLSWVRLRWLLLSLQYKQQDDFPVEFPLIDESSFLERLFDGILRFADSWRLFSS